MKNRLFTEEELKEMGIPTIELAIEAVEKGDKEKAKQFINLMYKEAERSHDTYVNWVADLMDYIYVHVGVEDLEKALMKTYKRTEDLRIKMYQDMDIRSQVQHRAASLKGHLQKLEIEEDDEKVCIKMVPCGSGQRLIDSGAYDPPRNLSRMKPHRITYGLSDFPVYCAHAPVGEIYGIEKTGHPLCVKLYPAEFGTESCRFCVYKDPKYIPEEAYERVGLKKPK